MAQYITPEQLSKYDTLVKRYVDEITAKTIKTVTFDSETHVMKFYKQAPPVKDDMVPAFSFELTSAAEISEILALLLDSENSNGLEVTENGLKLNLAVASDPENDIEGTAGAISAEDKKKLDCFQLATEQQVLNTLNPV